MSKSKRSLLISPTWNILITFRTSSRHSSGYIYLFIEGVVTTNKICQARTMLQSLINWMFLDCGMKLVNPRRHTENIQTTNSIQKRHDLGIKPKTTQFTERRIENLRSGANFSFHKLLQMFEHWMIICMLNYCNNDM